MYPELFRIGSFPITTYGIFLALGMLLALFLASRLAARDGLPRERIYDLGLWVLVGGLLGSKLLMFVVEPDVQVFTLDFLRSGGVYYGGFIGGLLALVILIRFYKLPFWKVADALAPGLALGQAFGRQGCFAAGCCWGKHTDLPWGVHFTDLGHQYTGVPVYGPDGSDLYLHPTQLYESFTMLAVCGLLIYLHRTKKFDGQVLIAYGIVYGLFRFLIEFIRDDPRGDLWGLTTMTGLSTSQMISLIVAIGAVVFMFIRLRKASAASTQAPSDQTTSE
jgi:phosphatidylglycerol:prolipoprotein diacylglycerol transferase